MLPPSNRGTLDLDPNRLTHCNDSVLKKVDLEKSQQRTSMQQKHEKLPCICKVKQVKFSNELAHGVM